MVVLISLELACRLAGYGPTDYFQWTADPDLQVVPMPNQQTWFCKDDPATGQTRLPIRINRYSQRGGDYPLPKAPGVPRIVIVGDSLTFGQGVRDHETFPAQLQAMYEGQKSGRGQPQVINAGVNSWSSWHYRRWVETQMERFDPDVIVVGLFAGNDMEVPPGASTGILVPGADLLRQSAFYRFLATQYRAYLWKRIAATKRGKTPADVDEELLQYAGVSARKLSSDELRFLWERNAFPNLERMRDAARAYGVSLVCFLIPTYLTTSQDDVGPTYEWIREQVEALGIPVVAGLSQLRAAERRRRQGDDATPVWLPWDKGHLAPDGNRLAAESLASGLRELGLIR